MRYFILTLLVTMLGLKPSYAGNYYLGIASVKTEFSDLGYTLDDNGYLFTLGRSFDVNPTIGAAIEFNYANLLDTKVSGDGASASLSADTMDLSAVVSAKGFGKLQPFARAGFSRGEAKLSQTGDLVLDLDDTDRDDTTFFYGLGLDLETSDSAAIRLEFVDGADYKGLELEQVRLGVIARF